MINKDEFDLRKNKPVSKRNSFFENKRFSNTIEKSDANKI